MRTLSIRPGRSNSRHSSDPDMASSRSCCDACGNHTQLSARIVVLIGKSHHENSDQELLTIWTSWISGHNSCRHELRGSNPCVLNNFQTWLSTCYRRGATRLVSGSLVFILFNADA